ncbi:hypothetical protein HZC21_05905 [Candidatus Peregrinibacteria bacterium]|nr:hypothetical protein [Candidatus Peregrinibacteria bacterium]
MKNLNIPALATAITLIAPVGEGCSDSIQNVQDDTHQQVGTYNEQQDHTKNREKWLLRAELAEQKGDFHTAGEGYARSGYGVKAREMYLKHAKKEEQAGNFGVAALAYRTAGDEAKSKDLWLKHARESEKYAYKMEEFDRDTKISLNSRIVAGLYEVGVNVHLCIAAESYEEGGDKTKAKEVYFKYAQVAEQRGYFYAAAQGYEHIGDNANAKRLWLQFADEAERGGDLCGAADAYKHIGYEYKSQEIRNRTRGCDKINLLDIWCR